LYIPLFGANDARVGIHGVFAIMPAILFGPWYGAVVSGLADVLGFIFRSTGGGAWLWQLTVIMVAGGFIRGWAWRLLRSRSPVAMRVVVIAITIGFIFVGGFSMVQLRQEGITRQFYDYVEEPRALETYDMNTIGRLVIRRSQNAAYPYRNLFNRIIEVTVAPLGVGLLGIILLAVDFALSKGLKKEQFSNKLTGSWNGSIMPLALTVIVVSLLINTANSLVLWGFAAPAWGAFPFAYIWLPRATVALLNSVVNVFVAVLLLRVCYRLPHLKALME